MRRWYSASIRALLLTPAAACWFLAGACGPPCDRDALQCGDGGAFTFAPDCSLDGELDVALGQGETSFEPLAPEEEPTVHEGSQGGRHMFLAIQVANASPDYSLLKVELGAGINDPDHCDQPDCDPWVSTAQRELVLDLPAPEDGLVTQAGLLLVLSLWPEDYERRVELDIVDQCRREGTVEHLIPAAL